MPHCCVVKSCAKKITKGSSLSFHRFPVKKPTQLRLWLLALGIDVNTDQEELKKYFVCSKHFAPGDYTSNGLPESEAVRRYLTPTAVPTLAVSSDTSTESEKVAPIEEETEIQIQVEDVKLQVKHEDDTLVSEELPSSLLQQCNVKLERAPTPEETDIHIQIEDVLEQQCDIKLEQAPIEEETEVQIQVKDEPLQWCQVKDEEEDAVPEETEFNMQVKEEQSPGIEIPVEQDQPVTEENSHHLCGNSGTDNAGRNQGGTDQQAKAGGPSPSGPSPSGVANGRSGQRRPRKRPHHMVEYDVGQTSDIDSAGTDDVEDELWSPKRAPAAASDSESDFEDVPEEASARPVTPSYFESESEPEMEIEPEVHSKQREHGSRKNRRTEWKKEGWKPREIPFTATPGPRGAARLTSDQPIDFVNLIITDELMQTIADQTNLYADQEIASNGVNILGKRVHCWKKVTVEELRQFFGLFFLTGIIKKPSLASYWEMDEVMATPYFSKTMSRNRFQLIWRFLHFNDNQADDGSDQLYKVRPVLDYVVSKFGELYQPNSDLCIDEGMMAWRGRLAFRVYNAQKPIKYGIKSYILCDSKTGYCFGMKPYCGEAGNLEHTVVTLLDRLAGQGYKLYMDNDYTSVELAETLLQMDTHICGTLRKNRGGPQTISNISNSYLEPGETIALHNNRVMVLAWRDKKNVNMITSLHKDTMQTVGWHRGLKEKAHLQKPTCVVAHNNYMNGVDKLDQNIAYYPYVRKSAKWTKKFVLYLFQICLFNALILYKARNPQGAHRKFLTFNLNVVRSLTTLGQVEVKGVGGEDQMDTGMVEVIIGRQNKEPRAPRRDPLSRLSGGIGAHVMAKYRATLKKKNPTRACRVCRKGGHRSETRYYCTSCHTPLHLNKCFALYHTKYDFAGNQSI